MKGGKRQAVSPRQHTPGWKFGTTTDKPPWGFDVSEDLNSCHPEDIDRPLKASDLRFGLLYRAIGQPSRHLNTAGFTGGSITGNITGRPALSGLRHTRITKAGRRMRSNAATALGTTDH
jgi:hypothetical protein